MADPRATFEATFAAHGVDLNTGDDRAYLLPPDGQDSPEFVCANCGQALMRLLDPDGHPSLVHERSWVDYDHDPEPVVIAAGTKLDQLCDFCGINEQPYWHLKGDRIVRHTGKLIQDYGGTWAACDTCGQLLQRNDLEALLDRTMADPTKGHLGKVESRAVRLQILADWVPFLRSVTEMVYVGPRPKPARMTPQMMPKLQAGLVKFWNNPNLKIGLCSEQKTWATPLPAFVCGDTGEPMVADFSRIYGNGVPVPESVWDAHVKHQSAGIWGADLYWVSSKFTSLAIMAGKDFETVTLDQDALPSDSGFLMWEDPVGEIDRSDPDVLGMAAIRAVHWSSVPGGIWVAFYVQVEDADPNADIVTMRQKLGWLLSPNTGSGIRFGEIDLSEYMFVTVRTLLATLFLLNQPGVAEVSNAAVDKREARKYQRNHQRPQPLVRLVNLRRQPERSGRQGTSGPRGPIDYRVYRKGHWKQVAYGPKRGQRRPHYVSGYIAGPDGAPLRPIKSEVKVLK